MLQDLYAKCGNNCGRCTLYAGNLTADQNVLAAAVTAQVLADFGAVVQHIPQPRKAWLLKLSLERNTGGLPALRALQRFAVADMRVLAAG